MEQNEEMDLYKVDIAKAALSCNVNLVVAYNKNMLLYHEALQEMTEKNPDKILTLPLFCAMVNKERRCWKLVCVCRKECVER